MQICYIVSAQWGLFLRNSGIKKLQHRHLGIHETVVLTTKKKYFQ